MLEAAVNSTRTDVPTDAARAALAIDGLGKRVMLPAGELVILDGIGFSKIGRAHV